MSNNAPVVTCLLDGGWSVVTGAAIAAVARSRRKMKVDAQQVVGWRSPVGGTFSLMIPSGDEFSFALDGRFLGRIPNVVPPAGAAGED